MFLKLFFFCFVAVISGRRRFGTDPATETTPGAPPADVHTPSGEREYGEDTTS